MRVGIIGINHKLADLTLREKLALACQKCFGISNSAQNCQHFILLSTCNRTEIYFSSNNLVETHSYILLCLRKHVTEEFEHKFYSYFGIDCFVHLTKVTAGLDSAIFAETEIQGQVKACYELTKSLYLLPADMHFLFQKALNIAKKIRFNFCLGQGLSSLHHIILKTCKSHFCDLKPIRILMIGASTINLRIANFFQSKRIEDITICNRTKDSALLTTHFQKVKQLDWAYLDQWVNYDLIILATKAPYFLIDTLENICDSLTPKLILDLSVPRNADPLINQHSAIQLLNIDELNCLVGLQKQITAKAAVEAEQAIFHSVKQHMMGYVEKINRKEEKIINIA